MDGGQAHSMGELFERHPVQFGLRGDVYLWEALGDEFADVPLPESWFELSRLVRQAVEHRVGRPPSADADPASVYMAEFDPGRGMSAGHVHLRWWATTGIPILLDRFEAARARGRGAPSG